MNRQIPICFLLIIFHLIVSCEKETIIPTNTNKQEQTTNTNVPPNTTTTSLAGFGNRLGTPSGYPFDLPYNTYIVTPIKWGIIDNTYKYYGVGKISVFFKIIYIAWITLMGITEVKSKYYEK